jgi:hypothetical protein
MKFPKYYIGPMSQNVIDCVLQHGQKHLIGFIPSRRQVDFSGGYVNNWNTKNFSEYVKKKNPLVYICRDHGGPLQGQESDDGYDSFFHDSQNFQLIHIDPFRVSKNIVEAAEKTLEYLKFCYSKNPDVYYEVGTEEAIFKYEPNDLDYLLNYLKSNLTIDQYWKIKYAVVQSGTGLDLSTRTNTGNFSPYRLSDFISVVKKYNLLSKEHNGDYLIDSFDVKVRYAMGLDAINIAPEFGQIESEYYLDVCKGTDLIEDLYQICYNSGKWKKWVKDINRVSKEQIIMVCCHYILSDEDFLSKIKSNFPNADKKIKQRINSQLNLLYEQTKDYCI